MECLDSGVPRLFDLVRVKDEQARLAFFFGLRDTVVADSLDQASRIAYGKDKRWGRVVTLKVHTSNCICMLHQARKLLAYCTCNSAVE